jgi:hypothetical protein
MDTYHRFGAVLRGLLIDANYCTRLGNPHWTRFADDLHDVHYETLRKAVSGERRVTRELMESCARALSVEPSVFIEYRLALARRSFDPGDVGEAAALSALEKWEQVQQ